MPETLANNALDCIAINRAFQMLFCYCQAESRQRLAIFPRNQKKIAIGDATVIREYTLKFARAKQSARPGKCESVLHTPRRLNRLRTPV